MAAIADGLDALSGARHVGLTDMGRSDAVLVTADIRADLADAVLSMLERQGVPSGDVLLLRLDAIGPVAGAMEPLALVWADLVGRARVQARAPARYFVFMASAGRPRVAGARMRAGSYRHARGGCDGIPRSVRLVAERLRPPKRSLSFRRMSVPRRSSSLSPQVSPGCWRWRLERARRLAWRSP
jgi:hypothetical protein